MNYLKLTLLLLSILTIMAAGIIAPALPALSEAFAGMPNAELLSKLVLSLPPVFIAISAPLVGRFIDRRGKLRLLYAALLLYVVAGCSGLVLDDLYHILIGRAFLGIAIGAIMTITITLIGDYFEGEERIAFIGYQSAFIGLAGIVFLTLGGFLADISWRAPFFIYAFPLLILPLSVAFLKESGQATAGPVAIAPVSNRLVNVLFANAVFFMILFYVLPTQLPFFLLDAGFEKKTLSGTALAVNATGMVVSSLLFSRIKVRVRHPYIYTIGLSLMAAGYFVTGLSQSLPVILGAMFLAGLGIGLYLSNTNLWVIEISRPETRGRNMGILTTCLFLGQFLSPLVTEPYVRQFGLPSLFLFTGALMLTLALIFGGLGPYLNRLHGERVRV